MCKAVKTTRMNLSVQKEFGPQIEEIWNQFEIVDIEYEIISRGFAVQDDIAYNSLMFIGINPSYNGIPGRIFYDNNHGQTHK